MASKPWGEHIILAEGDGWKVKRLVINPGGVLSLQRHFHREERWVVVEGTPTLQIGEDTLKASPGCVARVLIKEIHRISNMGDIDAVIIETQFGDILEEDDIERIADVYNRGTDEQ